jgi:hypothetical protein
MRVARALGQMLSGDFLFGLDAFLTAMFEFQFMSKWKAGQVGGLGLTPELDRRAELRQIKNINPIILVF